MKPHDDRTTPGPVAETTDQTNSPTAAAEPDWKRRQRLAAIFGDGVPEQTRDDRDPGEQGSGKGEAWYREQVPPHHGG